MIIKQTRIAAIDKYVELDRSKDSATYFSLFSVGEDGKMDSYWAEQGYTQVGTAEVEITLFDEKTISIGAVETLRKQRNKELAESQMRLNKIDEAIQNLLAIAND